MAPKDLNAERHAQMDLDAFRPIAMLSDGRVFTTAIQAIGKGIDGFLLDASDDNAWAEGTKRLGKLNARGWNIYFSPNHPRSNFSGAKPKQTDIPEFRILQVDMDPVDVAGLGHTMAFIRVKEAALALAERFRPNIVINSGNGIQMFWLLPEAVDCETAERLNMKLAHAADQYEGVSCSGTHNPDRITRVAGTLNWPSEAKLKRGYPEEPSLATCMGVFPDRVADVDAIEALVAPPAKPRSVATSTSTADHPDWPPMPHSEALVAQHCGWMLDAYYAALHSGETHVGDRSACLMGMVGHHKRHGLTLDESASLIAYDGGAALDHVNDQQYPARAVARAYERSDAAPVFGDAEVIDDHADAPPFPTPETAVPASAAWLERLANTAPGLIGMLVGHGVFMSFRKTSVPALGGALPGVAAAAQNCWVLVMPNGRKTPLGMMTLVVAPSGAGKETVKDVANYAVRTAGAEGDDSGIGVGPNRRFSSAAAAHQAMLKHRTQLWIDTEFGRYLRAAKGNPTSLEYGLTTFAMDAHTGALGHVSGKAMAKPKDTRRPVANGMMVCALASAFEPFREGLDIETASGGMLGRTQVLIIEELPPRKGISEVASPQDPAEMEAALKSIGDHARQLQTLAQHNAKPEGNIVQLETGNYVWAISIPQEEIPILEGMLDHYEAQMREGEGQIRGALAVRAFEQVLRIAGIAALGRAALDGSLTSPVCTIEDLRWADALVRASLELLVPEAEQYAAQTEAEKIQKSIMSKAQKLEDKSPKSADGFFRSQYLIQSTKGVGRKSADVRAEIKTLIDGGDLERKTEINGDGNRVLSRPEMLRRVLPKMGDRK